MQKVKLQPSGARALTFEMSLNNRAELVSYNIYPSLLQNVVFKTHNALRKAKLVEGKLHERDGVGDSMAQ
jgi:hypothetical protein